MKAGRATLVVTDLRVSVNIAPDGDQALIHARWRVRRSRRVGRHLNRVRALRSVCHADRSPAGNAHES